MKHSPIRLATFALAWLFLSGIASAQQNCSDGVAANGQCVDPSISNTMREGAVIFSQPQISFTAYPILPTGDLRYRYPHELIPNLLAPSPTGSPPPNPNPSDIRLKRDIVLLSRLKDGIGIYRFRYKWSDTLYVGVMAQEVMKVVPMAVVQGADGYLRVDYARLGLKFQTWDQWVAQPKRSLVAGQSP